MLSFIKNLVSSTFEQIAGSLRTLFAAHVVDETTLQELEKVLICADMGPHTTQKTLTLLRQQIKRGELIQGTDLKKALASQLITSLSCEPPPPASVYLLVGINGSGKTTCAAKLAARLTHQGKRVLLVAADTFRAAAPEQLSLWAQKIGCDLVEGSSQQDPASVVYTACTTFISGQYDALVIDTAGRLHTKVPLMKELEKIRSIVTKKLPSESVLTLLTLDAMLGQNSFEQAKLFKECTAVSGLILTKMDGTGKGGIVFAIVDQLKIPVLYLSFGEQLDQLAPFTSEEYVATFLGA